METNTLYGRSRGNTKADTFERSRIVLSNPIIIQGLVYELQSLTDKAFLGYLKTEYVSAIGAAQLPLNATMDGLVALSLAITMRR